MSKMKTIRISIDESSWEPSPVPQDILAMSRMGIRCTDTDLALLHTGLWTRPPEVQGFSLSDCWAWLRYSPALATTDDLRLRPEWESIDPHQKSVLSDDFGVGFTTELLSEHLHFLAYVDTLHFVRVLLPGHFVLGQTSKHGPNKSPDYIAIDNDLNFSVLECKGTQGSMSRLEYALNGGIAQKANLFATLGSSVKYSLVAGLYIARWASSTESTIRIVDPILQEDEQLFPGTPPRQLRAALVQIALAKHFALMGVPSLANVLSRTTVSEFEGQGLPSAAFEDLAQLPSTDDEPIFRIEYPSPIVEKEGKDIRARARRVKFRMTCSRRVHRLLRESRDICGTFEAMCEDLRNMKWKSEASGQAVELHSPLGFQLALGYDYE
ncbi:hypothetical protein ACFL2Q_17750 [Thermodesulfobacteriota bacterium]